MLASGCLGAPGKAANLLMPGALCFCAAGPPQATFDLRLLAGGAPPASSPAPPRQRDRHPIIDTKSGFPRISDVVYISGPTQFLFMNYMQLDVKDGPTIRVHASAWDETVEWH